MQWQAIGKTLIILGIVAIAIGLVCLLLGKLNFTGLPGDITIKKGNFTFFFPVLSCIVLSIILTIILNLFFRR